MYSSVYGLYCRAEQIKSTVIEYTLMSGTQKINDNSTDFYVVGIASMKLPVSVTVDKSRFGVMLIL